MSGDDFCKTLKEYENALDKLGSAIQSQAAELRKGATEGGGKMNCGYCRDCKYAERFIREKMKLDYLTCSLAETRNGQAVMETTKAFAYDSESYHAELQVQPDFGCVQFQEKEK